jgi:predicted DNA-binding protein
MSNRRLSIRISPELQKQLAAFVRKSGRSESEVVREALEEYCQKETKKLTAYDVFKRAGLIGCSKGLPSDLSTNPKYMEGFGRD